MKYAWTLAVAVVLGGCGTDPQKQLDQAKAAFAQHDFVTAKLALGKVVDAQPNNWPALEMLARTTLALGDGEAAASELGHLPAANRPRDFADLLGEAALLRDKPELALQAIGARTDSAAQRIRALAAIARSDNAAAEKAFAAGAAPPDADARLLADYARFKLLSGDRAGARTLIDTALRRDPGSLDILLTQGQIATAEGNLAAALDAYAKAHAAYPDSLAAITGQAASLGDLGRTAEMQKLLDANAANAGHNLDFAYLQARAAAARNDWSSTHAILQSYERDLPTQDNATILYAQSLARLGQPEQGRALVAPIVTRHPEMVAARRVLAAIELQQGDGTAALETLRPLVSGPTATPADQRLAAEAAKSANSGDAAHLAQAATFPTPQALGAKLADADTAMRNANWANAAALYGQILGMTDGKNPMVLNNLAFAESQLGNKASALDHALTALKYAPNNPSVMDTAGWLLFETGKDRARARSLLADAARLAPQNATIARHLKAAGEAS